jgi:hypothetical protein
VTLRRKVCRMFLITIVLAAIIFPLAQSPASAQPAYCSPDDVYYDNPSNQCGIRGDIHCPWYSTIAGAFGYQTCTVTYCIYCH